jgi:3-oxoadipate enol-lactonase
VNVIDRGSGPPLILIPGIQGRWEYLRPAIDALSASFRVLTFSLRDEPSWRGGGARDVSFDEYADQVGAVLDEKALSRAVICGVSFGGLIALRFAARHPARTDALILVSTPSAGFRLRRRHEIYVRLPWILGPLFLIESPARLRPELRTAIPDARARRRFTRVALQTLVRAPLSISRMAARGRLLSNLDVSADCERIAAPTLIVTGERGLDYVVPVDTSSAYTQRIRGAQSAVIERTGHLGSITRPDVFASVVRAFVDAHAGRERVAPVQDTPDAAA